MEPLTFEEIAELLGFTRTISINKEPVKRRDGWALYEGVYRVHTFTQPFQVLYLHSRATREALEQAARDAFEEQHTQVVYAPSLDNRLSTHRELFARRARGFWNTREYLRSFIKEELGIYTERLGAHEPKYYVDPQVETPSGVRRKIPPPLLSLLVEQNLGTEQRDGALGVVLAEAGHGKTYKSQYLVAKLSKSATDVVPIYIDSSQWSGIPIEDLGSLWKTIAHSFRHFGASIGWIEGHEDAFIRATLKAQLFVVVFDGFDEYVLRNGGQVQPLDVLETLADLAQEAGTRILITSRTSFWESSMPEDQTRLLVERKGVLLYRLLPFEQQQARNYFQQRLVKPELVERAARAYGSLRNQNQELIGRGFVLSLLADLVERGEDAVSSPGEGANALMWLLHALCKRETLRQQLAFNESHQLTALRSFACEVASGQAPTTDLLDLALEETLPDLDAAARENTIEKLRSHPLVQQRAGSSEWRFREDQISVLLLADALVKADEASRKKLAMRLRVDAAVAQDIAAMVVDLIRSERTAELAAFELRAVVQSIFGGRVRGAAALGDADGLATNISMLAVDRLVPRGSQHADRTAILRRIAAADERLFESLLFRGTIASFDFRDAEFVRCRFERVTWAGCEFGPETAFRECHFAGGMVARCVDFGASRFEDCRLDPEASAWLNAVRIEEGRRRYSQEDLERDFHCVISKFVTKGGFGLRTIRERHLTQGAISASRHKDEILDVLLGAVLETHVISGIADRGVNVRPAAADAVKFYAANNVRQGVLALAFERLERSLKL